MSKFKCVIDDGFNSDFVETAFFDGILEMPVIERPSTFNIPKSIIPFSKIHYTLNHNEFVSFYEYDSNFSDILRNPNCYQDEIKKFQGMISPDCSLYVDSPLTVQIANTYRSRAIGHYFQSKGIYVIPNVRWGDERSYTTSVLPEKFAFLGLPKQSILSIGTFGACKSKEEKYHLRNGLIAMIEELEPKIVLVYGSMPKSIFGDLQAHTTFVQYPDWISLKKGGKRYGNR